MQPPTHGEYSFRFVERFAEPRFDEMFREIFYGEFPAPELRNFLDEDERAIEQRLRDRMRGKLVLRLGAFHGEELVGWSVGWQDTDNLFFMGHSAVLPNHRRRGIYGAMLRLVLERTRMEGFQAVHSKHLAANNAVIIPKLAAGFHITGMGVLDWLGTTVELTYYHHAKRKALYDFRVGREKPPAWMKTILGF